MEGTEASWSIARLEIVFNGDPLGIPLPSQGPRVSLKSTCLEKGGHTQRTLTQRQLAEVIPGYYVGYHADKQNEVWFELFRYAAEEGRFVQVDVGVVEHKPALTPTPAANKSVTVPLILTGSGDSSKVFSLCLDIEETSGG